MSSSVIEMHMAVVQHVAVTEDSLALTWLTDDSSAPLAGIPGCYTANPKNATIGA